jgi:hypothetical protein
MTPAQFGRHVDGHNLRQVATLKQEMAIAWNTAAFHRAKRMPNLTTILNRIDPPKRDTRQQSMADMLEAARAWNKLLGGAVKKKGPSQ